MKPILLGLFSATFLLVGCDGGGNESFQDDLEGSPGATQSNDAQELGDEEMPDNILQARTAIYRMADDVFERLADSADQEELRQSVAVAVFAPEPPPGDAGQEVDGTGIGLHRESGEVVYYDLRFSGSGQPAGTEERYVILFHDEDLYATFREGELNGEELEQISRNEGSVVAGTLTGGNELEDLELAQLEFRRNDELTNARIADPEPFDFPG